jgi:hypothetical protein
MVLRSISLPGRGYFYTGHPLIAILRAVVEAFLVIEILLVLSMWITSELPVRTKPPGLNGCRAALMLSIAALPVWS